MTKSRTGTKQHIIPATHIGRFSDSDNPEVRKRPVWVKRRNKIAPYRSLAENVASERDFYTISERGSLSEDFVDHLWDNVESSLTNAVDTIIKKQTGTVNVSQWITMISFIAQLFVRGREFNNRHGNISEDLLKAAKIDLKDNINFNRVYEMQLLKAPIMYADWTIVHNSSNIPIILNDMGYVGFQDKRTPDRGYAIPLTKNALLMIAHGERSKTRTAPIVYKNENWFASGIRHKDISKNEVLSLNESLAVWAIDEVYGATEDVVRQACLKQNLVSTPNRFGPGLLFEIDSLEYLHSMEWDFLKLLERISESPK